MHYLNNAGASIMSDETLAAIVAHFILEREIGPYAAAQRVADRLTHSYAAIATTLGVSVEGISLHDSASRAWNMAIYGSGLSKGDDIVTLSSEFGTNLVTLHHYANQVGATVHVVKCDQQGAFDLAEFERHIARGASLVAISHAAAHGSIVNPVEQIGALARRYGVTYIIDGCQAVGQIPVDVARLSCDAYTGSGRKWLRGPRGTAFLYVRPGCRIKTPQVDLASADLILDGDTVRGVEIRSDGRQFELWERSVASFIGLGIAVEQYLTTDRQAAAKTLFSHASRLRATVASNPRMHLVGQVNAETGIVGFVVADPNNEDRLQAAFNEAELVVSTMADWDCPLHFPKNGATKIFRLSPHFDTESNTIDLAERVLERFR